MKNLKCILLLILMFCSSFELFAIWKEVCEGFYVTNNGDTLQCSFRVPLVQIGGLNGERGPDLNVLNWSIEINDSIKGKNKLRLGDAKSFSFFYNDKAQTFLARPNLLNLGYPPKDSIFLKTIVDGPLRLYEYQTVGGGGNFPIMVATEYFLQWKEETPFVPKSTPKKFREDMIWYLAACTELTKKIATEEYTKKNLEAIVNEYNNCKK